MPPTEPLGMTPSPSTPLGEASPNSLEEYFSRDPNDLQDQDVEIIVQKLRSARAQWLQAEANGTTRKASSRATAKSILSAAPKDLGLGELDLDI